MALSDIYIIVPVVAGIVAIGATTIGLAYRIGNKLGKTEEKVTGLTNQVNKVDERLLFIERIFMNNSPMIAGGMLKRFSLEGEKKE
jgi:hypothetical protein